MNTTQTATGDNVVHLTRGNDWADFTTATDGLTLMVTSRGVVDKRIGPDDLAQRQYLMFRAGWRRSALMGTV